MPDRTHPRSYGLAIILAALLGPVPALAECLTVNPDDENGLNGPGTYALQNGTHVVVVADLVFNMGGAPAMPGQPRIVAKACGDQAYSLATMNRSLRVIVTQPETLSMVAYRYCNYGGVINASAVYAAPPTFIGHEGQLPGVVPGQSGADVTLDLDPNQPQPNDTPYTLSFTVEDGLETALFGGNETLINQICFEGG